jgi:cytochrome c556
MVLAAAAVLAGCAAAAGSVRANDTSRSVSMQEAVAARQAAFGLSANVFMAMKGAIDSGAEVKPLAGGARNLARWARALPGLFPDGSALPDSKAKPLVWERRSDFEAKAAAYAAAATKLAEAAQAGDKAAFAAAWKETGGACKACHDLYRTEPAH